MREAVFEKGRSVLESKYFMIVLSLITLLSFVSGFPHLALYSSVIVGILVIIFKADFKCILGVFLLALCANRKNEYIFNGWLYVFFGLLIIYAGCLIYYIVVNRIEVWSKIKKDFVWWSLVAILVTMFISLINTPTMQESFMGIGAFSAAVAVYFVARTMISRTDETKEYMSYSFVIVGITLALEIFITMIFRAVNGEVVSELLKHKQFYVGIFHQNHIMAAINICFIMSIYYFIKCKKLLCRILTLTNALLFVATNLLMTCRGGYLGLIVSLVLMVILYVYTIKKSKETSLKQDIPYWIAGLVGSILILIIFLLTGWSDVLLRLFESGFDLSGRDRVYEIAWNQFTKNPIIGSGVYTSHFYLVKYEFGNIWNYHNYILQILSTCGILGGIGFTSYLVFSIKRTIQCNLYSLVLVVLTAYFLVHGALDTLYFNRELMLLILIPLAILEERMNNEIV